MSSGSSAGHALERRSQRRIAVHLPMHVRAVDHEGIFFEEETSSENLCRNGAAFAVTHELDLGVDVEIHIPMPSVGPRAGSDFATHGRVVHVAAGGAPRGRVVGVQFTGPQFNRVFVPETPA